MKQILAIVKPFRAQKVLEAIGELGVDSVEVSEAKGYGRQKDQLPRYRGSEYNFVYLPKIEIKVLAADGLVERLIERIADVALTGRIGDGKILVMPIFADIDI